MLSIIIVNYKSSKDIHILLESIVRNEPGYEKFEFIIVDNNSNDDGLDAIKENFPFVKMLYSGKNGGFAYGNNIGIKEAKGDCIFLLNPDTYISMPCIEKLYDRLRNTPDWDMIGPKLLFPDG